MMRWLHWHASKRVGKLKAWMTHHRLQLNDDKTEVFVITTPSSASKQSD